MRQRARAGRAIVAGAAAAALGGLAYVGWTWSRYGRTPPRGAADPLLDRFMPDCEVRERHETRVAAPAEITWEVVRALNLQHSPLVRAIFRGRELLLGAEPGAREPAPNFLGEVLALGWRVLAEEPGREIVLGAVTQPWKANVEFRGLAPEEFTAFAQPGYAKIAWTLAVVPTGPAGSIFRTETRVVTTDAESRRRFRRYWSLLSPGIRLIRYESLRLVRRQAAARLREATSAPDRSATAPA